MESIITGHKCYKVSVSCLTMDLLGGGGEAFLCDSYITCCVVI